MEMSDLTEEEREWLAYAFANGIYAWHEGEPVTQYYLVSGNNVIFADDAALTQEIEVWTRR